MFFTVASMGLCFGFVLKTVFMIQGCFSYCWAALTQSQGLFCFSHHPTSEEAGGAQEAGRGHSRDSWPQLTKGIFHTISHHAQHRKLGEGGGRAERLERWRFSSQVTVRHDGALLAWRWLNTCLPMGSSEWIPCFAFLARMVFLYLLSCLYLNPRVFSLLPFQFSPPSHQRGVPKQLHDA